jgi:ubiquinone/menaquinone biosynthesis C-methylase UbiE
MDTIERVPRTSQQAATAYTRLSRWYDLLSKSSEGPYIATGLRLLNAQAGERALEIGFGTGHGLIALAQGVGQAGRVYGIDLSPGMIEVAREQIEKEQLTERVVVQRGDVLHLPYATGAIDVVFSSFMLDLIDTPDLPIALNECRRVLRANGRLGIVSMSKACAARASNLIVKVYERAHRWLPALIDCRPLYVQTMLATSGFHIDTVQTRSMWGLPVEIVIARKET